MLDGISPPLTATQFIVGRLVEWRERGELPAEMLSLLDVDILVPAPPSAEMKTRDAVWPARSLAEDLLAAGFGRWTAPLVTRVKAVEKLTKAGSEHRRPQAVHLPTMMVLGGLPMDAPPRPRFLVVDDVITSGATVLAAATRLIEAYPRASVAAFAGFRVIDVDPPNPAILPTTGLVRYSAATDRCHRKP